MMKRETTATGFFTYYDQSQDCLLPDEMNSRTASIRQRPQYLSLALATANVALLLMTCILWMFGIISNQEQNTSWRAVSLYSPLFEKDIEFDINEATMDHSLWGTNESTSIYIQDPSPEVDAAWEYISAYARPIIPLSRDEVVALERDPDAVVKVPQSWGMGDGHFLGQVTVFHEIHCLNMLRKDMWWDHYYQPMYGDRENEPYLDVRHKRHCLRKVLQALMCSSSVDIITHDWRRGTYHPIADFDNPRKCRNFESLLEWNNANAIPFDDEVWRTIKRPDNAIVLPKATPNLYTPEDSQEWIDSV